MRGPFFAACVLLTTAASCSLALAFDTVDDSPAGARFDPATNFDILNLRPGMTIEEVKAELGKLYPDDGQPQELRLEGNVATPDGAQVPIDFVSELKRGSDSDVQPLYRYGKPGDWPTIYLASEVYGGRVLAVDRALYFDEKQPMGADAMRLQIEKKYGKPTLVQRSYDGHVQKMQYLYANGRLLADTQRKLGVGETCTDNGNVSECETIIKTRVDQDGRRVTAIKAKTPCAGMAEFGRAASYKYMGDERVEDHACDGMLTIDFIGVPANLDYVYFYLEDVKRAYGHKLALDAAINAELGKGGAAPASSPRL